MPKAKRPHISFVVPTLNRGRYVVRAVASCLNAATDYPSVTVEIIVLDSESDDGSWEELQAIYATDDRVRLFSNKRGLGPTRSWLDGARLITGDYVTFLWSDDYISPQFLKFLVPLLDSGCDVAIAGGLIRDIDDENPLPSIDGQKEVTPEFFLSALYRLASFGDWPLPVSPASSLFSRRVFDRWIEIIEAWAQSNFLRQSLMWRRAIGPDLMLFLIAADVSTKNVPVLRRPLAQFSQHEGSITVSSSTWPLRTGYWLARVWLLHTVRETCLSQNNFARMAGRTMLQGIVNAILVPPTKYGDAKELRRAGFQEVTDLWCIARKRVSGGTIILQSLIMVANTAIRSMSPR